MPPWPGDLGRQLPDELSERPHVSDMDASQVHRLERAYRTPASARRAGVRGVRERRGRGGGAGGSGGACGPAEASGEEAVGGEEAAAAEGERRRERQDEEVELEALAALRAEPVHEEAVRQVRREDRAEHDRHEAAGGEARPGPEHEGRGAERLGRSAPGVRIQTQPWGLHRIPEELARGSADLVIGFYDKVPPHHREQILFEERYACLVRKGHPRVGARLTLKTYVALQHVMVSQSAGATSGIDRALAALGHTREVSLRVSHVLNVPAIVASTDLVAALSRRVAEPFARILPLRLFEPPLRLRPSRVGMAWHEAVHEDPAHRWLRGAIALVAARV